MTSSKSKKPNFPPTAVFTVAAAGVGVVVVVKKQQATEAHRVVSHGGSHIFLDNRFIDGGDVSLTHRPPFTA
jgi:hypothetical protein